MQRIGYFIRKTYVWVIFIVVEIAALRAYAYSTPQSQARMLAASNVVVGRLRSAVQSVGGYFALRSENESLTLRIASLQERLAQLESAVAAEEVEVTLPAGREAEYIAARVVTNSINRPQNFITIDKGIRSGVAVDMAVLTPEGCAVGYVVRCSENFAVVMTLLNTDFRTGGSLLHDGSTGSIRWRGGDPQRVELDEVSKYAAVGCGDSVVTSGISYRFPAGLLIGTVEECGEPSDSHTTVSCGVRLAADMVRLRNVIVVGNTMSFEARALEADKWGASEAACDGENIKTAADR